MLKPFPSTRPNRLGPQRRFRKSSKARLLIGAWRYPLPLSWPGRKPSMVLREGFSLQPAITSFEEAGDHGSPPYCTILATKASDGFDIAPA